MFKIGEKTGIDLPSEKEGIIPNPEWKAKKKFNGEIWRIEYLSYFYRSVWFQVLHLRWFEQQLL